VLAWIYIMIRQIIIMKRMKQAGTYILRHGKNNTGIGGIGALPLAANISGAPEELEAVIVVN
jgi:hypothetical protein